MFGVTGKTPIVSNIMQIVSTVRTFLVRDNVFRTVFSMTSRLQGQVSSLHKSMRVFR